jgi:threonine synthase
MTPRLPEGLHGRPRSPTRFSARLSQEFNAKVYLKPETHSATGSYKDRIGPAAVAEALQAGATKVVVASSGNQGLAIAHAARAAGLPCLVLAVEDILPAYQSELHRLGATLERVPDMTTRSIRLHEREAEGWFALSVAPEDRGRRRQPGKNGYAEIAHEIVAALGAAPDILILPVCFGDGCSGILLGFRELARERGTGIPQFIMVRATYSEGVAFSITSDLTTPEVASTLEATQGLSMYFTNEEFLEAQRLARTEGLDLEPAAAGPFLALRKFAASPGIPPGRTVVLLLTAKNRA